jgi:hypothetical protein
MDVKKETAKATNGGRNTHVVTPETGKVICRKSMIPSMGLSFI